MRRSSKSPKFAAVLFSLSILLLALSSQLVAQSARARIIGTVTDPQGAVLPGATVTVTNTATGVQTKTTTDQEGQYQAFELPIGSYKVKVEREGFKTTETVAYTLEINQVQRIDVRLAVGTRGETIEITGDAAQVETVNPTLGASVTSRPVVNLPLNGRNVLDLAGLQPGVMPRNPDDTGAGSFNIAGSRADSVTFLLDGGVNNNLLSNGVVLNPNPDTVQEFRILTSNYTAEYGRNAGGVISVVTKSGTNQIHGSVFEFLRNEDLNANSYFNNLRGLPRDVLKRNQYGATLGGPVIKDKLFAFGGYQGQKLHQIQSNDAISVPTPAEINGDFSALGTGAANPVATYLLAHPFFQSNATLANQGIIDPTKIDPIAQKYIQLGLIPTDPSGNLIPHGAGQTDYNEYTFKFDYVPSTADRITWTLGQRRTNTLDPLRTGSPGFPTANQQHNYFTTLSYTRVFSPNLLNEFHATGQRQVTAQAIPARTLPTASGLGIGITPDNPTGPPRLNFSGGLIVGFSSQGPTTLVDNTFGYSDTLSWTRGHHSWKFGAGYLPYQDNTVFDFFINGEFRFRTSNGAGDQFANFLLGRPRSYLQFPAAPSNIRQKSTYFFGQDEWHILSNLVLTLGTRYEYSTPKSDNQGRSFSVVPGVQSTRFVNAPLGLLFPGDAQAPAGANFSDKNDWAPRIGFAWDPFKDGKTSIRGGAGVFYDVLKGEDNLQFNGQPPFFGFAFFFFPKPAADPGSFLTDPFGATGNPNPFPSKPPDKNVDFNALGFLPFGGDGVFFVNPNLRTPYTIQYNLSVQREVAKNTALELGYVGSQSRKLTVLVDRNPFDPATINTPTPHRILNEVGTIDDNRFSFLPEFENATNASYNALTVGLTRKPTPTKFLGTTYFTVAYTYAHTIDNGSGFRNRNSAIPFFKRNLFRASSDFDLRHQLAISGGWDLPFDTLFSGAPKRLVQGWSLYPILKWTGGFPQEVFSDFFNDPGDPGPSGAGDGSLVHADLVSPLRLFDPSSSQSITFDAQCGAGSTTSQGHFLFDPRSFNCATTGYGTAPRNFFRGPHFTNLDLALAKTTKITERSALEFRSEFFNITNHSNFKTVDTNIDSNTFGQVISAYDPRILQFGVRVTF